jgi:hypothetical protein
MGWVANGNISPSVFVKLDTTTAGRVLQAGAGDDVYGVSQQGVRNLPYASLDDGFAAIVGENIRVYEDDEECWIQVAVTVTAGQKLKPTTGGVGTPVTANNDIYGCITLQDGTAGKLVKVKVQKGASWGQ